MPTQPQRDSKGRLLPGAKLNPLGRRKKSRHQDKQILEAIASADDSKTAKELLDMIARIAVEKESTRAAALWLSYKVPKPQATAFAQSEEDQDDLFADWSDEDIKNLLFKEYLNPDHAEPQENTSESSEE